MGKCLICHIHVRWNHCPTYHAAAEENMIVSAGRITFQLGVGYQLQAGSLERSRSVVYKGRRAAANRCSQQQYACYRVCSVRCPASTPAREWYDKRIPVRVMVSGCQHDGPSAFKAGTSPCRRDRLPFVRFYPPIRSGFLQPRN